MEQDRFETDKKLYLSGMFSLIAGLSLLIFSLYLLPHLVWNLSYKVPIFVQHMYYYLHTILRISDTYSQLIIFLTFFISGLILTIYAYFASNKIENKIYQPELAPEEAPEVEEEKNFWLRFFKHWGADFGLLFKLLIIVGLVFLAAYIIEWLIGI